VEPNLKGLSWLRSPTRLGALALLAVAVFFLAKRSWLMGCVFLAAWAAVELVNVRRRKAREQSRR
jgi:hypothetical protein